MKIRQPDDRRARRRCKWCKKMFSVHELFTHCIDCTARDKPHRVARRITCRWCNAEVPAKQFQLHLRDYCAKPPSLRDGTIVCTDCQAIKQKSEFYASSMSRCFICKACTRIRANAEYSKPSTQIRRKYQLAEKMYGITQAEYDALYAAQSGLCAICHLPPSGRSRKTDGLFVDHDHVTGRVRGLLCHRCNHGIGNFRDDIALLFKAIEYLRRHQSIAVVR